jgi:hypothetical protein
LSHNILVDFPFPLWTCISIWICPSPLVFWFRIHLAPFSLKSFQSLILIPLGGTLVKKSRKYSSKK